MNIIKRLGVGFYVSAFTIILGIVGLAMYASDFGQAYYQQSANVVLVILGVLAIILLAANAVLPFFKIAENKIVKIVLMLAMATASIIFTYIAFEFLRIRVYDFGVVLGSDLELGNQKAFDAIYHSIGTFVVLLVTIIGLAVTSFLTQVKPIEEQED